MNLRDFRVQTTPALLAELKLLARFLRTVSRQ
jgi:hypothetical protein